MSRLKHPYRIGDNIRRCRVRARLTQASVALSLGLQRAAIAQWETQRTNPTVAILPALASILEVEISELFKEQ